MGDCSSLVLHPQSILKLPDTRDTHKLMVVKHMDVCDGVSIVLNNKVLFQKLQFDDFVLDVQRPRETVQ